MDNTQAKHPLKWIDSVLPYAAGAHLGKIAFPLHFAAQAPKTGLSLDLNQHAQTGLDHSPFGRETRRVHGLFDQFVIDHDIGAYAYLLSICPM